MNQSLAHVSFRSTATYLLYSSFTLWFEFNSTSNQDFSAVAKFQNLTSGFAPTEMAGSILESFDWQTAWGSPTMRPLIRSWWSWWSSPFWSRKISISLHLSLAPRGNKHGKNHFPPGRPLSPGMAEVQYDVRWRASHTRALSNQTRREAALPLSLLSLDSFIQLWMG